MKTNMKKQSGFTLIELLVVIVIMGILATISTATFSSYFSKARDAKRISAVQNMKMLIQVDNADNWEPDRYNYTDAELKKLFDDNDFVVPTGENNLCYYIGVGGGTETYVGDDNRFVVLAWLEDKEEVAVDGSSVVVAAVKAAGLAKVDFACGETTAEATAAKIKGLGTAAAYNPASMPDGTTWAGIWYTGATGVIKKATSMGKGL